MSCAGGGHTLKKTFTVSSQGALSKFIKRGLQCVGCRATISEGALCKHCQSKEAQVSRQLTGRSTQDGLIFRTRRLRAITSLPAMSCTVACRSWHRKFCRCRFQKKSIQICGLSASGKRERQGSIHHAQLLQSMQKSADFCFIVCCQTSI